MIEGLIDKGFAYAVDGDVYFRVRSDDDYGKLSRRDLDSLKAGVRVEVDERKEDPLDFALWKSRKPGEPTWDSPWGPGRPGWHIECSAMSLAYLGETLDVHGGGRDLVFPHHENEIAQTESFTSKTPFVRFWMHNGTLQMNEDKMSKSLGNIITAREAIERFSSDAIRLFFLGSHYRSPLGYSDESVASQERAAERLCNALRPTERGTGKSVDPSAYRHQFIGAMDDDLNTPRAVAALFELAREINRGRERAHDVGAAQDTLKELSGVLGLTLEEPSARSADVAPFVQLLVDLRSELRGTRQFALADRVRDELASLGVSLEDGPEGTAWRLH
jgi:cysteinyl-tRNA synthetase